LKRGQMDEFIAWSSILVLFGGRAESPVQG
jgi:hypothetical protein